MELHKTNIGKNRYLSLFPIVKPRADEPRDDGKREKSSEETIPPCCVSETVVCKNIWYDCSEDEIREWMKPFGPIDNVHLPVSRATNRQKGFAVVTFAQMSSAIKAISALDNTVFQGRLVRIMPHRYTSDQSTNGQGRPACWNSLFVSSNVIAERLSKRFSMDKRELYDQLATDGGSLPVRLAAAEADIVEKTRKFLVAHGVQLDALANRKCVRSKRILLVKNVDIANLGALRERLGSCGAIERWIFPPEWTGGIVEFKRSEDATTALGADDLKPVVLEPAPTDILESDRSSNSTPLQPDDTQVVDTDEPCVVYVKGLNFSTTNETLQSVIAGYCLICHSLRIQHFESIGPCSARIAYNNAGLRLSMGYGFVAFRQREHAREAIKTLQHCSLDGHKLELALSQRQKRIAETLSTKRSELVDDSSTKICVRNIPFQVTEKEVGELFAVFGQLRSVRLPKKVDGGHRGFGFVDFVSHKCAKSAFDALSPSTHMFARRLVLEWADAGIGDDLETQRKKARYYEAVSETGNGTSQTEFVRALRNQSASKDEEAERAD